jgi:hypothetical protein
MVAIFDQEAEDFEKDTKLKLGRIVHDNYMGPKVLNLPVGTNSMEMSKSWLEAMGFTNVEWAQPNDFTTLLLLWYTDGDEHKHFILEFVEDDTISLFEFSKELTL